MKKYAMIVALGLFFCGCSAGYQPSQVKSDPTLLGVHQQWVEQGRPALKAPNSKKHALRGKASWYGERFQGRSTASGEPFDMYAMTAAHRSLPFGTVVEVRHPKSERVVVVRVNDRGPFTKGRVIDLSYAAAQQLGMVRAGVVPVEVRVVRWGSGRRSRR